MRNYQLLKIIYSKLLSMREVGEKTMPEYWHNLYKIDEAINLIELERPELKDEAPTGCDYGIGG